MRLPQRESTAARVSHEGAQCWAPLPASTAWLGARYGALLRGASAAMVPDAVAAAVCGCCAAGGVRERRAVPLPVTAWRHMALWAPSRLAVPLHVYVCARAQRAAAAAIGAANTIRRRQ